MTKQEQKRNLTWKLKDQPTAQEVADLVNSGVINAEEGREIIFGSPESDKDQIKALKDQVSLLLKLVESIKNNTPTVISLPYTYTPSRPYWEKYWMGTTKVLNDSGYQLMSYSDTSGNNTMSVNAL